MQALREIHAVRPGIKPCAEIDYGIDSERNCVFDEPVDGDCTNGQNPLHDSGVDHRCGDLLATLSGQESRERVVKECIGPFRFHSAVRCDPHRGVGDISDGGIVRHAEQSYFGATPFFARNSRIVVYIVTRSSGVKPPCPPFGTVTSWLGTFTFPSSSCKRTASG